MSERNPQHLNVNRIEIHRGFEAERISKMNGRPMRVHQDHLQMLRQSGADKIVIDHTDGRTVVDLNKPTYKHN